LIELLVVVAIIGILATVVLASLGSARNAAKDSAIKASMSSLRAQGELFAQTGSTYTGFCASAEAQAILKDAGETAGLGTGIAAPCFDTDLAWGAEAPLVKAAGITFCTDSTGFAGDLDAVDSLVATGVYACK